MGLIVILTIEETYAVDKENLRNSAATLEISSNKVLLI
jgi:hypothetical protein